MGRRKLLPNFHNLLQRSNNSNSSSAVNESTKDTSSASSNEAAHTHNTNVNVHGTFHHHHNHHLHVFTWPSLKRRPSSSSLTSNSTEDEHDTDPDTDTDHETDSHVAHHAFRNSHDQQLSTHKSVVSFGNCEVRTYTQVLGDHPCCSEGCPIQLGWSYTREESMKVDDYERYYHSVEGDLKLQKHTVVQDLRLTPEERRSILILCKQQEHAIAENASVDSYSSSSHNEDNESTIDAHSALLPAEHCASACTLEKTASATCERELSRECRRLNRCGGWNVNVKATRKRNKRNQEAFFGAAPTRTTSRRIPSENTETALL